MKSRSIVGIIAFACIYVVGAQGVTRYDFQSVNELKEWSRFYETEGWPDMMKSLKVTEGRLVMEPYSCGWYADYHGTFLFQQVEGDFTITAKVEIKGVKAEKPTATWSLSGLMVREPRSVTVASWKPVGENWIFLTTGVADNVSQPVFETKTTRNSRSMLQLHPNRMEPVELKIQRIKSTFVLSYRYEGEEWVEIEQFERPDFLGTLQVGINAYTDFYGASRELRRDLKRYNTTVLDVNPDLKAEYDYVIIQRTN